MPVVSIIIPCYNAAPFIAETIASVRAQSHTDWEVVVVDDGSTDESGAIVSAIATEDSRVRLARQENGGLSCARNTGFAHSDPTSRYLHFLDADDCLERDMLSVAVNYLDARPSVGMVYSAYSLIDSHGRPCRDEAISSARRWVPRRFSLAPIPDSVPETSFTTLFLNWCGTLSSGSVLRRAAYLKTAGWDTSFRDGAEDTDLFLQMALCSEVHYLPGKLFRYRRHPGQATSNNARMQLGQEQLYRKWRANPQLTPAQQATAGRAWSLRQRVYLPYHWTKWGNGLLRQGRIVEGALCYVRAGRQLMTYRREPTMTSEVM